MILRDAIDHYVAWRRAHGARFITSAGALYQFCRSVPEQACCDAVTESEVRLFLAGTGPLTRWRAGKYGALAGFYRYAISRGYATRSPLPAADEEPRAPASAPPYIFSREELQRLFKAIDISRRRASRLDADTFRTLLLVLYGAGLRTSEALHLTMRDVDLADAVMTVRNTKFYKSRLVPVACQLAITLRAYAERRSNRPLPEGMESAFLANRDGTQVRKHNVDYAFKRLLETAGIDRKDDGRRAPCLHALRHYLPHRTMSDSRMVPYDSKGL
jgi:site-specific recombinase XerD